MKSLRFLIVLSFISYSLTISINKIYHLEKYTKFEYDPSNPSFTIIDPSNFKDSSYIYLTYKSNDDSILDKDLSIQYSEKNLDLNFEPSKVIKGEPETKKEKENDYFYQISFIIQKEDQKLIIVQNLVSDGNKMELENKKYTPLMSKIGIIIVFTILFAAILVGLIMLSQIRGESTRIITNEKNKKIMKNQNIEMDYEDNNDIIIKPMRKQKPAASNDSTEEDNDNNELNSIN